MAGVNLFAKITGVREEWRTYWKEMAYYVRYVLFGLLASFIPFFLAFSSWRAQGALLYGLLYCLTFGVIFRRQSI